MTYKVQIDDLVRDATAEEIAFIDAQRAKAEAQMEAQADKATARATLLVKLGITEAEAQLLLGGM